MKTVQFLPDNYAEILTIDLQKNKKLSFVVNTASLLLSVLMFVLMHLFVPIGALFDFQRDLALTPCDLAHFLSV